MISINSGGGACGGVSLRHSEEIWNEMIKNMHTKDTKESDLKDLIVNTENFLVKNYFGQ